MLVAACVLGIDTAHAEPTPSDTPGISYLWDGGALPLIWGAYAATLALDRVGTRSTPLWFSANEGGASPPPWEIPTVSLTVAAIGVGTAVMGFGDHSRWYHAKGIVETLATNGLVTSLIKKTFGRHRPDWTADSTDPGKNQSFMSGHATAAFSIATYSALYLHEHVFDGRSDRSAEIAADAGIAALALTVDVERVIHHRHHATDVIAGSLVGAAEAALIFYYQERRFRSHGAHTTTITPLVTENSVGLVVGGELW